MKYKYIDKLFLKNGFPVNKLDKNIKRDLGLLDKQHENTVSHEVHETLNREILIEETRNRLN